MNVVPIRPKREHPPIEERRPVDATAFPELARIERASRSLCAVTPWFQRW